MELLDFEFDNSKKKGRLAKRERGGGADRRGNKKRER